MVTTFVRSAGDRTKGVWKFLSTVCQTDTGIKLAELEHSSLRKCIPFVREGSLFWFTRPFIGP